MSDAMFLSLFAICALAMARNELVHRLRMRRLREVSARADLLIRQHKFDDWRPLYAEVEATNYFLQVLDLRKWTYRQFWPEVLS